MSPTLKLKISKLKQLPSDHFSQTVAGESAFVTATLEDDFDESTTFPNNMFVSNEELGKLCGPCSAKVSLVCVYDTIVTLRISVRGGDDKTIEKIHDRILAFFHDPSVLLDYEDDPVIPEPEER